MFLNLQFGVAVFISLVGATPVPAEYPRWRQGPVAVVKMEEPKPIVVTQLAEARQYSGQRMPFEMISEPYQSSSNIDPIYRTGGYAGLQIPFHSVDPLNRIMGNPLISMLLG